jgi:hypothetical protein
MKPRRSELGGVDKASWARQVATAPTPYIRSGRLSAFGVCVHSPMTIFEPPDCGEVWAGAKLAPKRSVSCIGQPPFALPFVRGGVFILPMGLFTLEFKIAATD